MGMLAQYPGNANDWVEFDKTYYKIAIQEDGLYRITAQELISAGLPSADLTGAAVKLFRNGEEVPVYVSDMGPLSGSDFIEFRAFKNDGSADTGLYEDPDFQPSTAKSLFSETAIYFLTLSPGTANLRIIDINNDITSPPAKETYFMEEVAVTYDDVVQLGTPYPVGGVSLYSSTFEEAEGFVSGSFSGTSNIPIETPDVVQGTGESATLSAKFTYFRLVETNLSLTPSFALGSSAESTYNWTGGFGFNTFQDDFPSSVLSDGETNLTFRTNTTSGRRFRFGEISLRYPRGFSFSNQVEADFTLNAAGEKYYEIDNMQSGSGTSIIYDESSNERIQLNNGSGIRFKTSTNSTSNTIYISNEVKSVSLPIESTTFTDYAGLGANLFVIYHPSLESPIDGENQVDRYIEYRESSDGGSFTVAKVNIEDAYDQYAYGIEYHCGALKNLFLELNDNGVDPEHIFIIGKGHEYIELHSDDPQLQTMLIPPFGLPGSDNLYVTDYHENLIRTSIGRVATKTASDLKIYVDKIVEYEATQQDTSDPVQTKDKIWMKEALHLGGGANSSQQNLFRGYLNDYKSIIEQDNYGAKVTSVFKTSTDPVQIAESVVIDSLIDRGISIVTFFGHAAANVFEFNLRDPANYENEGKYPVILTNGCLIGNLYNTQNTLSEDFVLEPNKGSIAFMGPIQFGVAQGMRAYSESFYENFVEDFYDDAIGTNIRRAINESTNNGTSTNLVARLTAQQMIYHGDPVIKLNPHAKPDYLIETDDFALSPNVVTADDVTFDVNLTITNIGKAVDEQVVVNLTRIYPDGTEIVYSETVGPILYNQEVTFTLETDPIAAAGLNNFRVEIDPLTELDEITVANNILDGISTNIVSNTVTPAFPYEFGISSDDNLTLKASSVQFYETDQTFLFEIDTTANFDSPFKQTGSYVGTGGVVSWTPSISYENERVYYWRTRVEDDNSIWRSSSFVHLDNTDNNGWNQSHYYQFLENNFASYQVDDSRDFQFADNNRNITVTTGIFPEIPYNQMAYYLDGDLRFKYTCAVEFAVAVFDENSGIPWENVPVSNRVGLYESNLCKNSPMEAFLYRANTAEDRQKLMNMLDQIPDGKYVLIFSQLAPNPIEYDWASDAGTTLFDKLEASEYGATGIRDLADEAAYMLFTKKNDPSFTPIERVGVDNTTVIDEVISLTGVWSFGNMTPADIGPAINWDGFEWEWNSSLDNDPVGDVYNVDIFGVGFDGATTLLFDDVNTPTVDLSGVDANQYPFLRLRLNAQDAVNFTSPQLVKWRVLFDKAPELAITNLRLVDNEGSAVYPRGKDLKIRYDIENISDEDMTPVLVDYTNTYGDQDRVTLDERYAELPAGASISVEYDFSTNCECSYGKNSMLIDVNPNNDQLEQYHFNNVGLIQYQVLRDNANPYLDVTFDGIHIIDGDLVAEQPSILITLTDENDYLALDQPEDFKILVQEPNVDTLTTYTVLDNPDVVQFYPADANNLSDLNKATIEFSPSFIPGEHIMIVQGKDISENNAGSNDYKVSFEVTGEDIITRVINYPNPFSSRTEFIANIVGDAPDQVLIQIFSQNGRVIKEIQSTPDQISVSEGNNFYKLAEWNGEDDYGDPVGNGLYFYKVTLKRNGEIIQPAEDDRYDEYFYNGLGKLYIVR